MSETDSGSTMIRFKCPNCDSDITADAQQSGVESTCPKCTHRVVIPPTGYDEPNSRKISAAVHQVFDSGDETAVTIARIMAEKELDGGVALSDKAGGKKLTHQYLSTDHSRRYDVGDVVGAGGMGAILAARDLNIWRHVAMKVMLNPEKVSNSELLRFLEEAQVTGQLEHPNIVPVHELGVDSSGHVYYTMKLIRGTSLKDVIAKIREGDEATIREYPLNRLMNIYLKLCDAIAFAHSKGVIHRDLKPENVMLGDYGEVLVLDWGLAKIVGVDRDDDELIAAEGDGPKPSWATDDVDSFRKSDEALQTMVGTVLGTPSFMAPEQAHAQAGGISFQTDVYALGGILYNLLTLNLPIQAKSMNLLLMALVTGKVTPPQDWNPDGEKTKERAEKGKPPIALAHCPSKRVPDSLAAVAMKALALEPDDRYADVKSLQADIEAWQAGFATEAEGAGLWRQLVLLVSRNRREFTLAGVAGLILVLSTTAFIIGLKRSRDIAIDARIAEEHQRQRAEGLLVEVTEEKKVAIEAKEAAEHQLYYANIAFAQDCIYGDPVRPVLAEHKLDECRTDLRHFEWRFLRNRLEGMGDHIDVGGWRKPGSWVKRVCVTKGCRRIYFLVQKGIGNPTTMIVEFIRGSRGWSRIEHELGRNVVGNDLTIDVHGKYLVVKGHQAHVLEIAGMKPILSMDCKGLGRVAFVDGEKDILGFAPSTMSKGLRAGCIIRMRSAQTIATMEEQGLSKSATGNIVSYPCSQESKATSVVVRSASGETLWSVPCAGTGEAFAVESPNGRYIALVRGEKLMVVERGGRVIMRHTIPGGARFLTEAQPAVLCFSTDSTKLCASGSSIPRTYLIDLVSKRVSEFAIGASLACFSNGKHLAVADRNILSIIDATSGELLQTIHGHDSNIVAMRFEPDGKGVISVSGQRILRSAVLPRQTILSGVFLDSGEFFDGAATVTTSLGRMVVADAGNMVAGPGHVASWQAGRVQVFDQATGKQCTFRVPEVRPGAAIRHVSFSRTGQFVLVGVPAVGNYDLALHRSDTGERVWLSNVAGLATHGWGMCMTEKDELFDGKKFRPLSEIGNDKRGGQYLRGASRQWVGQKYRVALGGGLYNVYRINGNTRRMYVKSTMTRTDASSIVAINAEETLAAFVTNETDVTLHNLETAKQVGSLKGSRERICAIAMSGDGRRIATFDRDNRVRFWDSATGREIIALAIPVQLGDGCYMRFLNSERLIIANKQGKQVLMSAGGRGE